MNAAVEAAGASEVPASVFGRVVAARRSVYAYLPDPVPRSIVDDALRLAMLAPNHHKTRPWHFHVYAGAGRAPLLAAYEAAATRLGRDVPKARQRALDAPVMIVVTCVPDATNAKVKLWEEEFAGAAAVQTMLLALAASGVASLLTSGDLAESAEVHRLVGLESGQGRVIGVVNVGYRDPKRPLAARPDPDLERHVRWITGAASGQSGANAVQEPHDEPWIDAVVRRRSSERGNVIVLDLARVHGGPLPPFAPGAHIAVRCADDVVRHYSLCGALDERNFYRVAVKLEQPGRGGSAWLHRHATPGVALRISSPRNHFPFAAGKRRYLFISGGIGITPILPMLRSLREERRRARLVHLCRSPADLAFADELAVLAAFHDMHLHFDSVCGGMFDLEDELARTDEDTEVYCCGPAPVMTTVRGFAARHGRSSCYHYEVFQLAAETAESASSEFVIEIAGTARRVPVGADQTILAALRDAGIACDSECENGVCGTCAMRVVAGIPDHRDAYLTDEQRAANDIIMVCVSRSRSPLLTLDVNA